MILTSSSLGLRSNAAITSSGRNIIQAAAPGGEQGTISLLAPELDFGAIATQPAAPMDNPEDMLGDACDAFVSGRPSTLIERGAGGVPPTLDEATGVDITLERMERILEE